MILKNQHRLTKSKNVIIFNKTELPNEDYNAFAIANELIVDLNLNNNIILVKRIGETRTARYNYYSYNFKII
jgi:hypothetical protein